jgi:hypothetical protein
LVHPVFFVLCVCTIHSLDDNQIGVSGANDLADAMKLNSSVTALQ